jgi:hypothetical protein
MVYAKSETNKCYQNEYNYKSKKKFTDNNEYKVEQDWWNSKKPNTPSLYELFIAYNIFEKEKKTALALKSDKQAHCYIGCRISQSTSYAVADYTGWLKEDQDLKDCKTSTHYDEDDYLATLQGAHFGENDSADCLQLCKTAVRD